MVWSEGSYVGFMFLCIVFRFCRFVGFVSLGMLVFFVVVRLGFLVVFVWGGCFRSDIEWTDG